MRTDKEMKRSSTEAAAEQRNNKKMKNRLKNGFVISADTALTLPQPTREKKKSWQECTAVQVIEKKMLNTVLI